MKSRALIFSTFSPAVYHLAIKIVRHQQVAEDVLQNTFINLINKIHTYRFEAPFGMWLRKLAVNQVLMYIRKAAQQENLTDSIGDQEITTDLACLENQSEQVVNQAEHQLDLEAILSQLPIKIRTVLWLKEVEGYTHAEIAQIMNKTTSYSKSVVARAYELLRGRFQSFPQQYSKEIHEDEFEENYRERL